MLLTLMFAVVALATLAVLCRPLWFGVQVDAPRREFDRVVYRDQLGELERDLNRGVLNAEEAVSARLEIQRRLLAADAVLSQQTLWSERSPRLAILVGVLALLGAGGIYLWIGAPMLPDAPFASRVTQGVSTARDAEHVDMRDAAERLQQKLQADPSNPEGWVLLARTESMLGDWRKAADAYHRAIDLGLKSPDVMAGLGEMLVMSMDGIVAPVAHEAFAAALANDPHNDVARYYLALAQAQAGEPKPAIEAWRKLAADIPEDSPMREEIARRVADTAKTAGIATPALPKGASAPPASQAQGPGQAPGPNQTQMDAAAQMSPEARDQMVRGMVAQLAARLQAKPDDLDGWMRLGRAYAVLGETDKAGDAFDHAIALKPADVNVRLQAIDALFQDLKPSDPIPKRAVALLHEVQMVAPSQPEVLWYLGIVAARGGHPDQARDNWTKLLATMPPDSEDAKLVKSALDALQK